MQISETSSDSIQKLVEVVERECVRTIPARSQDCVDRWLVDHTSFLSEGKLISPLEEHHTELVNDASLEWSQKMGRFLRIFGGSETNFSCWFVAFRNHARLTGVLPLRDDDTTAHDLLYRSSDLARELVFNISWPITFAAYLPKAKSLAALECTSIGLQMSAVMWLENLAKARDRSEFGLNSTSYDSSRFKKLDALFDICQTRLR